MWEVWDQIRVGEVNVALWGQSDCPVAHCTNDRKEQWDITHPENTAQRVRQATWLCSCLPACLSGCLTVGLVSGWAHSHAWIQMAASVTMWLDKLHPRENVDASSCGEDRSVLISLQIRQSQKCKAENTTAKTGWTKLSEINKVTKRWLSARFRAR